MEFPSNVNKLQGFIGLGLLIGVGFATIRTFRITRYLTKNYDNLYKSNIDFKSLIKTPNREEHLIIDNLKCMPSPDLFKEHMTFIDREAVNNTKQFCFKQPCESFLAEIANKNEKYDVYCDCSTFDPFVASPVLINNYDLIKKPGKKQKLTMISYGALKYDKDNKRFNFQGHCFGTTLQQIEWVWKKILLSKTALYIVEGLALGIGFSLLYQNYRRWEGSTGNQNLPK